METREGYKKTKIGWIPEDWDIKKYKDVLEETDRPFLWDDNREYNLISVRRRNGGCFFRKSLLGHQIKTKTLHPIQKDDFIISKMQVVHGATSVVPSRFDGMFVSASYIIMNAKSILNIHYINYWAQLPKFYRDVLISSHGVHIEKMTFKLSSFMKLEMPIPPLPEQEKIASILTTVDDKISSIDQQIQQTEQLKKGLMEKLLTEGIGHTEFKDTKIGRIPVGWEFVNINDISTRKSGHTPNRKKPEYWNGGIKWVSLADTYRLDRLYLNDTEHEISEEGIQNSSAVKLKRGAVIISRDAGIGKSTIINDIMAVSQHFIAWECGVLLSNVFLYYLLQKWKGRFERIANGTTIKTIGLDFFKKMEIPLPPVEEQKQIATILSSVDGKIDVLQSKKASYTTLKKGLMAQLLTGQMRVKI